MSSGFQPDMSRLLASGVRIPYALQYLFLISFCLIFVEHISKTMYELAKQTRPDVRESVSAKLPSIELDLSKYNTRK